MRVPRTTIHHLQLGLLDKCQMTQRCACLQEVHEAAKPAGSSPDNEASDDGPVILIVCQEVGWQLTAAHDCSTSLPLSCTMRQSAFYP